RGLQHSGPATATTTTRRRRLEGRRGGLGEGLRAPSPVMDTSPIVHPAKPALQLPDRGVERRVEVACSCLGTNDRALALAGDLDALAGLGLPGIGLVVELHVVADDLSVVTLQSGHLPRDVVPIMLGNLHIATLDDDVHSRPPRSCTCEC